MDRGGNEYVFHRVYGYNVIESLLSSYDKIVYHEWILVFVVNLCLRICVKCDLLSPTRSLLLYFTFVRWRWILVWKNLQKWKSICEGILKYFAYMILIKYFVLIYLCFKYLFTCWFFSRLRFTLHNRGYLLL